MFKHIYLGTSIAISWAWGTSLILGMEITRTKGLESFLIWATANCLTLAVFGILYKKGILRSEVLDQKGVKIVANLIQLFCLVIQLKILNETLQSFFNPIDSYVVTLFFSGGLVLWMYKKGLAASILTDWYQGIGTLLVLGSTALICFWNQEPQATPSSSFNDISWGLWSGCILLSGIMTDIQHWQRAEVNKKGSSWVRSVKKATATSAARSISLIRAATSTASLPWTTPTSPAFCMRRWAHTVGAVRSYVS